MRISRTGLFTDTRFRDHTKLDKKLICTPSFANDRGFRFVDADQITDAQFSYSFSGDRLEGLQLLFQINNLTNEPYVAYSQEKTRVLDYQEYGTQYLLGLNYRF